MLASIANYFQTQSLSCLLLRCRSGNSEKQLYITTEAASRSYTQQSRPPDASQVHVVTAGTRLTQALTAQDASEMIHLDHCQTRASCCIQLHPSKARRCCCRASCCTQLHPSKARRCCCRASCCTQLHPSKARRCCCWDTTPMRVPEPRWHCHQHLGSWQGSRRAA